MATALHKLMRGLIDYAGLFPPAALDLERAVATFDDHRRSGASWMLGRFVCPLLQLEELAERLDPELPPPGVTVIMSPVAVTLEGFSAEVLELARVASRQRQHLRVESIEVRLPQVLLDSDDEAVVSGFFADRQARLAAAGLDQVEVYWERPITGEVDTDTLDVLVSALAKENGEGRPIHGLKLRCGGLEPAAVPSAAALAAAVVACNRGGLPFKATAGLHHPIRHDDVELGVPMHGFVNLFGGAALIAANDLDVGMAAKILDERDPEAFRMTPAGLTWDSWTVSLDQLEALRATFALSYGSCSFDEPLEDLVSLGWLEEE